MRRVRAEPSDCMVETSAGGVMASVVEAADPARILIISHSHPELTKGGGEIAAYQLYRGIMAQPVCEAWFMGCDRRPIRSDIPISQPFGTQDYLYSAREFDWFKFANRDAKFPEAFTNLLLELSPNVVHFHHYIGVGVEAFALAKRVLPNVKIVVTLHEFLAICNHYGQMVTRPDRNLCYREASVKCVGCFQEKDESDFFLRKKYIQHFFDFVDHFVSPSQFLSDRYIAWGIPENRISVIENVVRAAVARENGEGMAETGHLRVGFFGQLSFLKGANVLFEAARLLDKQERSDISFDIFGDYRNQPVEFQKELQDRLETIGSNVRLHGPYDEFRVDMLMRSVDVIIMPSIWWENSPVVIQEAFRNGRPVICSDIGGMAEKVRNGIDGFHFHAGSALDIVALLTRIADDREILRDVMRTMRQPPAADEIVNDHLNLYRTIRASASA